MIMREIRTKGAKKTKGTKKVKIEGNKIVRITLFIYGILFNMMIG